MGHQLFGEERMVNAIPLSTTSQEIIKQMTAAVNAFTGEAEQSDDITLFALKRK
jgi:serine phosphatase RsbU (regulator of sigma subunit)